MFNYKNFFYLIWIYFKFFLINLIFYFDRNNNDDNSIINGLSCNENNTIFSAFENKTTRKHNSNSDIFNSKSIKIITTDFEDNTKISNSYNNFESSNSSNNNNNSYIIINNNINNYNNNISYNNVNNFNHYKNEHITKKRNRFSSFEGIFPYVEKETWCPSHKKSIDDNEILNNFCASIKYEENFDEDDLENKILMNISTSDLILNDKYFLNKKRNKPEKENLHSRSRVNVN